jgi:Tfp pilus assembly protein PilO
MKLSLGKQQQQTLLYSAGAALALALAGGMIYDLTGRNANATKLKLEVERKEQEAASIQFPGAGEESRWNEREQQLSSSLLSDQAVAEFLEEVTRIANENHLQRLGITNEDKVVGPNQPASPEDAKLPAVGIRRYLLVTLKFQSEYPDAARFMAAVASLARPVDFQVVDLKRNPPWVDVTVTFKVYRREAA